MVAIQRVRRVVETRRQRVRRLARRERVRRVQFQQVVAVRWRLPDHPGAGVDDVDPVLLRGEDRVRAGLERVLLDTALRARPRSGGIRVSGLSMSVRSPRDVVEPPSTHKVSAIRKSMCDSIPCSVASPCTKFVTNRPSSTSPVSSRKMKSLIRFMKKVTSPDAAGCRQRSDASKPSACSTAGSDRRFRTRCCRRADRGRTAPRAPGCALPARR